MRILFPASLLGLMIVCVSLGRTDSSKTLPSNSPPTASRNDAATTQDRLRREFEELKQSLLRLKQRLEISPRPEDKARALAIDAALAMVAKQGTDGKFTTLVKSLRQTDAFSNLDTMQQVMNRNQELREDLRKLIEILAKDNREDQLRKEKEDALKTLEKLREIIGKQERVKANTDLGKAAKEDLAKAQKKISDQTKELAGSKESKSGKDAKDSKDKDGKDKDSKDGKDKDGKDKDGKDKDGKDKDGKDKDGKDKDGKDKDGKDKDGKAKDGKDKDGKAKDGKSGESKPGQGNPDEDKKSEESPPPESGEQAQAKKQIKEATKDQDKAEDKIKKGDNPGASQDQQQALDKLKQAQKKLEDLLQQLREEELKQMLAKLQARCEKLLNMQIAVKTSTEELDKAIAALSTKKPGRAEDQRGLELGDAEDAIVREATAAITLIEQEGSAIAFAEVFGQVRTDMILVSGKLKKTEVGEITQGVETEIIDTLKEMIGALKKARQDQKPKPKPSEAGKEGESNPNNDQRLLDQIAELKMVRSMQARLNQRTVVYGKQLNGEQPSNATGSKERDRIESLRKDLFDLGQRQVKITKVTRDMALGRNKAQ